MNGNDFLEKLELINLEFIEAADVKPKKQSHVMIRWVTIAACICLCITLCIFTANHFDIFDNSDTNHKVVAYNSTAGFYINDDKNVLYFPISFDDRVRYGLVPKDDVGLTKENTYKINNADIGEFMGTVTNCGDKKLVGCKVYHFTKYPQYDSICILEADNGYSFYTGKYLLTGGNNVRSDIYLAKFDLPNSLEKIEINDDEFNVLYEIKDEKDISLFFNIISNKEDMGSNEMNRRRADAWYKEYGNDDLYYDEATGKIVYQHENEIIKDGYTSTLEDGTTIVFEPQFGDTVIRDKAAELWSKSSLDILIISNNGFGITVHYSPTTRMFSISNNYYSLSDTEAQQLNALLQIMD